MTLSQINTKTLYDQDYVQWIEATLQQLRDRTCYSVKNRKRFNLCGGIYVKISQHGYILSSQKPIISSMYGVTSIDYPLHA